jgi:hypothetical protein
MPFYGYFLGVLFYRIALKIFKLDPDSDYYKDQENHEFIIGICIFWPLTLPVAIIVGIIAGTVILCNLGIKKLFGGYL